MAMTIYTDSNKTECECNTLSRTANLCLNSIYEVYFEPLSKPLSETLRRRYSFLGSFTFHIWYVLVQIQQSGGLIKEQTLPESTVRTIVLDNLGLILLNPLSTLVIGILFSALYARVIASGYTRHGPIRYFIGGVLLPAFVLFLAHAGSMELSTIQK